MNQLHVQLITPEGVKTTADVDRLTLSTPDGQITLLPHHIPLVTTLVPGEALLATGSEITPLAVHGGFCEVQKNNQVVILADAAEYVHELDERAIQEAIARAELLKKETFSTGDYEEVVSALERDLARRHVLHKYRAKGFRSDKPED